VPLTAVYGHGAVRQAAAGAGIEVPVIRRWPFSKFVLPPNSWQDNRLAPSILLCRTRPMPTLPIPITTKQTETYHNVYLLVVGSAVIIDGIIMAPKAVLTISNFVTRKITISSKTIYLCISITRLH